MVESVQITICVEHIDDTIYDISWWYIMVEIIHENEYIMP